MAAQSRKQSDLFRQLTVEEKAPRILVFPRQDKDESWRRLWNSVKKITLTTNSSSFSSSTLFAVSFHRFPLCFHPVVEAEEKADQEEWCGVGKKVDSKSVQLYGAGYSSFHRSLLQKPYTVLSYLFSPFSFMVLPYEWSPRCIGEGIFIVATSIIGWAEKVKEISIRKKRKNNASLRLFFFYRAVFLPLPPPPAHLCKIIN